MKPGGAAQLHESRVRPDWGGPSVSHDLGSKTAPIDLGFGLASGSERRGLLRSAIREDRQHPAVGCRWENE